MANMDTPEKDEVERAEAVATIQCGVVLIGGWATLTLLGVTPLLWVWGVVFLAGGLMRLAVARWKIVRR